MITNHEHYVNYKLHSMCPKNVTVLGDLYRYTDICIWSQLKREKVITVLFGEIVTDSSPKSVEGVWRDA